MTGYELSITRYIKAPRELVFDAWTQVDHLKKWWGPGKVYCPEAHIDLKVGGEYRIANQMPDGGMIWISGSFEEIKRPEKLVYNWHVGDNDTSPSLVTILFNERDGGTELEVHHRRIAEEELRNMHHKGWTGCLDKIEALFKSG